MKRVAILGSTGSIGTQALQVIQQHPDKLKAVVLTAGNNYALLIEQAKTFLPEYVVINDAHYEIVKQALRKLPIQVIAGKKGLKDVVTLESVDIVLTALVGFAGLEPTMQAIRHKKAIALANKETLVVAGELITKLCQAYQVDLIPVDSEHSAIFQCLVGEPRNNIEKIYLTASGGPFRGKKKKDLTHVTPQQALKHPNWSMGAKITIDSATLMNKGLEVIEAKWLFDLSPEQIDVIVHPQSIIHSIVQFKDGSMKAQMGLPDMKLPIQYALSYPQRWYNNFTRFNFFQYPNLTFESPDTETFSCLSLAIQALKTGGTAPCVLNAANEVAVNAFLHKKISFLQIPELIAQAMSDIPHIPHPSAEDLFNTDEQTRRQVQSWLN
ncbi:MAG: 1-deoxy-D-xylulose-5-phosphate reductoisomerase [Bacteroidia bacterium]|nr:1-deoxy-D-xylulose-5-phosphate reductoisomerase [Bacteroidia bacterium]MDW8301041.1 1-deoxy-D-xylulose-5-phosphate reductoisomerase [Bacteroidia bacterium]